MKVSGNDRLLLYYCVWFPNIVRFSESFKAWRVCGLIAQGDNVGFMILISAVAKHLAMLLMNATD